MPGVTIKAQSATRARVLAAVTEAVGSEVEVWVRELVLLDRVEVTLRPRRRWRRHGRAWRARVLSSAAVALAGELPPNRGGDVRWWR